jgi:pimeloyl-ACP methyl ester carboxylesterase
VERIRRDGLDLYYEVLGTGPDLVLLHPFPSCHELWLPVAQRLATTYRVVLPDLRAQGRSGVPDRPALMSDYTADIDAICRELKISKAVFGGISIGGYILFELWRSVPQRIKALAFFCTKAPADTPAARVARLQSAEQAVERGAAQFIDTMVPKLLGETTQRNRHDIVSEARRTMRFVSPQGIAMVQRGMAERPDSVPTLPTIKVPCLFAGGEEDQLSPRPEIERMHSAVRGTQMAMIPHAGHFAALEAQEDCFQILRRFCDQHAR